MFFEFIGPTREIRDVPFEACEPSPAAWISIAVRIAPEEAPRAFRIARTGRFVQHEQEMPVRGHRSLSPCAIAPGVR